MKHKFTRLKPSTIQFWSSRYLVPLLIENMCGRMLGIGMDVNKKRHKTKGHIINRVTIPLAVSDIPDNRESPSNG